MRKVLDEGPDLRFDWPRRVVIREIEFVKTAGLVGGLGPESTIDYYRRIHDAWTHLHPGTAPSLVIDSIDVSRAMHLVQTDRAALTEYLLASVRRLAGAGVDFIAITANTPHIAFDEVGAKSPLPLISIVEVCANEAARLHRMAHQPL